MMTTRGTPALALLLAALPTASAVATPPPVGPVPALVAGRPTTQAMEVRLQQLYVRMVAAEEVLTTHRGCIVAYLVEREGTKPNERERIDFELRIFEQLEAQSAVQVDRLRADAQQLRDAVVMRSQR